MPRIFFFEINAGDPEKVIKFYETVFGWKITKWEGPIDYWLVETGDENDPGIDGGIMKRENLSSTIYSIIEVSSIEDNIKKIEENGGKIIAPKMPIPGFGYEAYFKDSDGNVLGIFEKDETAK